MKVERWSEIQAGDVVHTSEGERTITSVAQYVAWVSLDVERPDGTGWSSQVHDGNWSLWYVTRAD